MKPTTTIIGAGIVGMSTAAFLQRAGHDVTIIDRVGPGEGCSFGNAGGVAFAEIMPTVHPGVFRKLPGWLMDPLGPLTIRWGYLPKALPWFLSAARNTTPARVEEIVQARAALGMRVVSDFETLLGDAGRKDLLVYRETLRLFDDEAQFRAEAAERDTKKRHGFPCEIYSGDQVREMEPAVGKNVIRGASHGGWYFVLNPEGVVKAIAKTVVANGGKIIADDVRGIVHQDGKVTALTLAGGGRHPVENLVVCAGAYSHLLARQLGERVLLEAERGYHIVLPDSGVSISRSLTYARTPGAATPMEMGLRLAGTDEFAGLEAEPNYARADNLFHVFKKVLPGLQPPNERATRWMGRRPGTPDSLPVIGRSRTMSNVVYGFGHGHMGLTWGPTTGRLVSEILSNKTPNMNMDVFRVNRF
ncbi:MAG: FAD-binding oxidoreductase [Rhizobiales bacterium]|nr:FAD-binding oxidoreductase [Hyphomicrobiales bacterium]